MFILSECLTSINAAVLKVVPNNGGNGEVLLSSSQSSLYASHRGMGISFLISLLSFSAFASPLPVNFCFV